MALAFLFPGQGSQSVGMLAEFSEQEPHFRTRLQEASEVLGFCLERVIASGPKERLEATAIAQPAILALSVALYEVWISRGGGEPIAAAGSSLGEYSALTASGVFSFPDAVRLVHERGIAMQEAVHPGEGAMAAVIGLDIDQVAEICERTGGSVAPANLNSRRQVVIAGTAKGVNAAIEKFRAAGAKRVVLLEVSVPSHCALMAPAIPRMGELLDGMSMRLPAFPVYHNVDAAPASELKGIRDRLARQLVAPVRWWETVQNMIEHGATGFAECGPGKTLSALCKRINSRVPAVSLENLATFEQTIGAQT